MRPLITILTPTYNRAILLERVYKSLKKQTSNDFEWLIIDDGSTDNTLTKVKEFKNKNFPVIYIKKANGGKHTALNIGVKKANGEYILMLDSDDLLPEDAVSVIIDEIKNSPDSVGGVVGRKIDLNGKFIGSNDKFNNLISNSLDIRHKHGVQGDLTEVFKRNVLIKFPFPEFEGEKFSPEALVWNRIAQKYDLLFFNKGIYVAEYQDGGLTNSIVKIRMNSPKASMIHYSELSKYNIPFIQKIKANINFWRFSFNDKDWSRSKKVKMVSLLVSIIGLPLGYLMYLNDKRKVS